METYKLTGSINAFEFPVKTFPEEIGEVFDELIKKPVIVLVNVLTTGLGLFKNGSIVYIAAAEEKQDGEAGKFGYEKYSIEAGNYIVSTLYDWRDKTLSVKDVCMQVLHDPQTDKVKPCIEWYKSDKELVVMVQSK